jgi:hypothetical protein
MKKGKGSHEAHELSSLYIFKNGAAVAGVAFENH